MARRVHGDRAVGLLYGQRALLIGALEPLTYTGTMLSTRSKDRPFKRLARTARIQETIFLGTKAEADEELAKVARLHETINGTLPEAAGNPPRRHPLLGLRPGADALDDGGDRRLRPGDVRDDGPPRSRPPNSRTSGRTTSASASCSGFRAARSRRAYPEFRAWFDAKLASPDLHATEHALEMAPLVAFKQPVPLPARGNLAAQNHLIKGTLPPRVREIFGIRWTRAHEATFRAAAAAHRRARRLFPRPVRRGRNDYFFDLVSRAEQQRGGTRTPELHAGAS